MKKVVVIGANAHQTPLIKKIQENGFEAHVFAWQMREPGEYLADRFYPISITEYARILDQCRMINPSAVLTICSDLTAGTVAMLNEKLALIGNYPDVVHRAVDKFLLRKLVDGTGVKQPRFWLADDIFQPKMIENVQYPVVVKPSDRSGGRGVRMVNHQEELMQAISVAKDFSFSKSAIVEEFINGTHIRVECISCAGKHFVLAVTQDEIVYVNDAFVEKSHRQGRGVTNEYDSLVRDNAIAILDAIGYQFGASSIEFIVDKNGIPNLIEVNASMCGDFVGTHLVPVSTEYDYLQATIDVAMGKKISVPAIKTGKAVQVSFILSQDDYLRLEYLRKNEPKRILLDSGFTNVQVLPQKNTKFRYGYYVSIEE